MQSWRKLGIKIIITIYNVSMIAVPGEGGGQERDGLKMIKYDGNDPITIFLLTLGYRKSTALDSQ